MTGIPFVYVYLSEVHNYHIMNSLKIIDNMVVNVCLGIPDNFPNWFCDGEIRDFHPLRISQVISSIKYSKTGQEWLRQGLKAKAQDSGLRFDTELLHNTGKWPSGLWHLS